MEKPNVYALPNGERGVLESLKVSDLGIVMARFRVGEGEHSKWINYNIGNADEFLSKNKIYNVKNWENEKTATVRQLQAE